MFDYKIKGVFAFRLLWGQLLIQLQERKTAAPAVKNLTLRRSSQPKAPFPVSLHVHIWTALSVSCEKLWREKKTIFHNSTCPLIIEAKTGTATTKPVGLNKVAAQKKQESSSEDSSSEDEEPPKVCSTISQHHFGSQWDNRNWSCRGKMKNKIFVLTGSSQTRVYKASSCCGINQRWLFIWRWSST